MTGQWLFGSGNLGRIRPWNERIAERHAAATERMLLGSCERARIVGNRRAEMLTAERGGRIRDEAPARPLVRGGMRLRY